MAMESQSICPFCQQPVVIDRGICPQCQTPVSSGQDLFERLSHRVRQLLEKLVPVRYREAQRVFPEVHLELEVFLEKVAGVVQRHAVHSSASDQLLQNDLEVSAVELLEKLKWAELFLTTACAKGNEAAWQVFQSRYADCVLKAAYSCAENASAAHELADTLLTDLFLPTDARLLTSPGKISQYQGIGSLEGWLRVIVTRKRIDQVRASRKQVSLEEFTPGTEPVSVNSNPADLVEAKEGQQAVFAVTRSLAMALSQLDDEERLVLNLYYLRQASLKDLGRLLKAHESTASRRLEHIRRKIQRTVERHLRQHFRFKAREIRHVIQMALEQDEIDAKQMFTKSLQ
jgi:RNA polymerase sigma-70 factor